MAHMREAHLNVGGLVRVDDDRKATRRR
jgi:hypothetical protein